VSHGDNDQNIQPGELPHEDPGGHKALVLVGVEADFVGAEGDEFDRLAVGLSVEDFIDNPAVVEGGDKHRKAEQAVRVAHKPPAHPVGALHLVHLPVEAEHRAPAAPEHGAAVHQQRQDLPAEDD
jgi:hypothetical protein